MSGKEEEQSTPAGDGKQSRVLPFPGAWPRSSALCQERARVGKGSGIFSNGSLKHGGPLCEGASLVYEKTINQLRIILATQGMDKELGLEFKSV